jgi:exodeoxyribonuclease VII large subunit
MSPDGVGSLYLAYEDMKKRLFAEGLFDEAHKKPIPKYPMRVGVITSPTGAAVRDIINVITRRFPVATIYLYPAKVQGEGASSELISAVDYFDRSRLCDVVIIGRGGGSIEDLWEFNSEELARRIFAADVPIISAVGHETDFTICDFVSDLRAPTPSAAAELCVPDIRELYHRLDGYLERAVASCSRTLAGTRERVSMLTATLKRSGIYSMIERRREGLEFTKDKLKTLVTSLIEGKKSAFLATTEKLSALNPLSVLSRGYSLAEIAGRVLSSAAEASVGDRIKIRLSDGALEAEVVNVLEEN